MGPAHPSRFCGPFSGLALPPSAARLRIWAFREEFVVRRRWLDEQAFADLVGLCQFLPGPASSQVGFAIGLKRAGFPGALAAWTGFTLPSAIALVLFAYGASALAGPFGSGLLHGLKLVAVAVVAQAVWGMARTLCPDRERASIALIATLIILFSTSSLAQIVVVALGGLAGLWLCRGGDSATGAHLAVPVTRRTGLVALAAFFLLLIGLPILHDVTHSEGLAVFDAFYRSGALVLGGGHVVLPLLREAFAGLDQRRRLSRGLWRGPGRAGAAVHFCGLSWRRCQPWAARRCRRRIGPPRHLPSWNIDPDRRVAVLGYAPETRLSASRDGRRQRSRGWPPWRGALQPRLDKFREHSGRFRGSACWFCSSRRLARASTRCRDHWCARRHRSFLCPIMNDAC